MQDQHATPRHGKGSLAHQGFRLVLRGATCTWAHPLEVQQADQDCTDMSDAEFERAVELQSLAADRAANAAKATPAYYAPSDLFALSLQNRGAL